MQVASISGTVTTTDWLIPPGDLSYWSNPMKLASFALSAGT